MVDDTAVDRKSCVRDEDVDIGRQASFRSGTDRRAPARVPLIEEPLDCAFYTRVMLAFDKLNSESLDLRLGNQAAVAADCLGAIT